MNWLRLPCRVPLVAIVLLGALTPAAAQDVFAGIDDPKVLPMLKDLPYDHGGMNVPRQDGRLLYDLIIERGYTRGLEIGTSNGYSTLWLGLAFRETGGKVITIEYEHKRAAEAQRNFEKAGLQDVIDARVADAFAEIPKIEGQFDFVFLDAWKPDYLAFWKLVRDRVPPGGSFTAHNVTGQENHMRDFLQAIRDDPDFETTIHEISRAGVSVSVRRN
jgi:predicted O-methyltransferase YrrM